MSPAPHIPGQMSLLDWQPPEPVRRFDPAAVRGATLAAQLARAVSLAMQDSGLPRTEIARRMNEYLGETVSEAMLNGYASPAHEKRGIGMSRFVALLQVTRDQRLLQLLAEMIGCAVIDRKYLPMIELASVNEAARVLEKRARALRERLGSGD